MDNRCGTLLLFLLLPGLAAGQEAAKAKPSDVEAAFLRNFAHYVTWPAQAFDDGKSPWHVCVLGDSPLREALEKSLFERAEQGRAFQVFGGDALAELPRCHIVVMAYASSEQRRAAVAQLGSQPVLTVGDAPAFLEEGGDHPIRRIGSRGVQRPPRAGPLRRVEDPDQDAGGRARGRRQRGRSEAQMILGRRSIGSRLALSLWGAALVGFVVAGGGLALFQRLTLERRARQIMEPYAQLVSVGTDAAVAFEDPQRAQEILDTLRANPHILEAEIFLSSGRLLATFGRETPLAPRPPLRRPDGVYLSGDAVELLQSLPRDARLRVAMGLQPLRAQTVQILWIFGAGVIVLLTVTLAQLTFLRRTIVRPIASLTRTAELVRERTDYQRRVPASGTDEVARLGQSFNAMMDAVQEREAEVVKLNRELELRVAQRTAQLEQSNRELESFSYSVSHDLRAPLRHINGFLHLLQDRLGSSLDDKSVHYMASVFDASQRMAALIEDLLAFSRMGRVEMSRGPVDLSALVKDVVRDLEPELRGRAVDWRIADLPMVAGDRAMLRTVLVNLLSNAIKFTQPRAKAEVEIGRLAQDETEHVVFVRDNGVGFDMKYAGKLFGVFQRLHGPLEFEGTGIGLANVRRVIVRHGGRTWAEGQVDGGATFFFSLPRSPPEELAPPDGAASGRQSSARGSLRAGR